MSWIVPCHVEASTGAAVAIDALAVAQLSSTHVGLQYLVLHIRLSSLSANSWFSTFVFVYLILNICYCIFGFA